MAEDEGFRLAGAYVELTVKDNTAEGEEEARRRIEDAPPAKIPTEASNPIDDAWRAKVNAAIKAIAADALDVPATPETEQYQVDLRSKLAEIAASVQQDIPLDPSDLAEFRAKVDADVKAAMEGVEARVPIEFDKSELAQMKADAEESASSAGLDAGSLMPVAMGAAITAGAPLIAGAMSAATVAGLIGMGVALQAGDPEIQTGWNALVGTAKSEGTQLSAVMVDPVVNALDVIRGNLMAEEPAFRSMFSAAAADVPILTTGLLSLVDNALPGLTNMVDNSAPIMQGFSTVLGDIGTAVSDIGNSVASNSTVVGQDLSMLGQTAQDLGGTLGNLLTIGSDVMNILGPLPEMFGAGLHVISTGIADVTGWITNLADSGDQAAPKLSAAAQSAKDLADDLAPTPPIFISATTNARQLASGIDAMSQSSETASGWLSQLQTNIKLLSEGGMEKANDEISKFYQGLDTMTQDLGKAKGAIVDANGNLDLTSKRGQDVQTAIENARDAMVGYAQSATDAGAPTSEITGHLDDMYTALEKQLLPAFGNNKQAVDNLLTSMGLVPKQLITDVSAPGAVTSTDQMRGLMQQIQQTPTGHVVTVTSLTQTAMTALENLGLTVKTLPNGQVSIVANTVQAKQDVDNFIAAESGRTIFVPVRGVPNPATGQPVLGPFHAAGGIFGHAAGGVFGSLARTIGPAPMPSVADLAGPFQVPAAIRTALHATGDLTPMAPVASVVPPNTWRDVVGDRSDVDEAYIPLDGSPRSMAILGETNARMPGAQSGTVITNHLTYHVTQQPQEDGYALAHRVSAQTSWDMMHMIPG